MVFLVFFGSVQSERNVKHEKNKSVKIVELVCFNGDGWFLGILGYFYFQGYLV